MIKARIAGDFLGDGISVRVTLEGDGSKHILLVSEDGSARWEPFDPQSAMTAADAPYLTLRLPEDVARALLDALLRYYEGASDMHTVRSDLLHERGRVDKLTDTLIRVIDTGTRT
jgi:hypothetical protein